LCGYKSLRCAAALCRQSGVTPTVSHQECSACRRMHPASWFYARKASSTRIGNLCKACTSLKVTVRVERLQRKRESVAPLTVKTCTSCSKRLPTDSFHRARDSRDGFSGSCGACVNEKHAVWVQERKQHFNLHPRLTVHGKELTCYSCKKVKALSEYNKFSDSSTGRQYYCKDCMKKYASARHRAAKKWQG